MSMYADDTKVFKEIKTLKDASALQADLTSVTCWSEGTKLQFNEEKLNVQSIIRKKKPINFNYNLNGVPLKTTRGERDLGVCVSADLIWKNQVMGQGSKAMKLFGYIQRNTRGIKSTSIKRLVNLSCIGLTTCRIRHANLVTSIG